MLAFIAFAMLSFVLFLLVIFVPPFSFAFFSLLSPVFTRKVSFPDRVILLRGNHETRAMTTKRFNEGVCFQDECVAKYGEEVYNAFMNCFDCLPLVAEIRTAHGSHLCMHGGIGESVMI